MAEIAPDLAEKALNADLRNIIEKVTDKKPLNATERELIRQFALECGDAAREARQAALLSRWAAGGRLTEAELEEIRETLGPAAPPVTALSPEPPAPSRRRKITAEDLSRWQAVYATEPRQLRRYVAIGAAAGDPCPLDEPRHMPAWWQKHMKQRCPEKILAAAVTAPAPAPAPALESEARDGQPPGENPVSAGTDTPPPVAAGFDLAADLNEGDEVRISRQLVAQFAAKLNEAMKANNVDDVQLWNRNLKEALETYRKNKSEDRESQKSRGLLISRAEVEQQFFGILKTLASLRTAMSKRIVAALRGQFPDLAPGLTAAITTLVETERSREDELFRDLSVLKSPEDVFRLAA